MLKKGDMILVVLLLAAVAAGFLWFEYYNNTGGTSRVAVIKQDNKVLKRIDLDKITKTERINVPGEYSEVILVEKGRIRFEEADCPDKVCVKTGWLTQKGDTAVCLPNRTIIKIEGSSDEVDVTTF